MLIFTGPPSLVQVCIGVFCIGVLLLQSREDAKDFTNRLQLTAQRVQPGLGKDIDRGTIEALELIVMNSYMPVSSITKTDTSVNNVMTKSRSRY